MKRSRAPLIITCIVLAFIYLPIVVLAAQSFNASRFGSAWAGFSLKWYRLLSEDRDLWLALRRSLTIGCVASLISTVLGTVSGYCLHRWQSRLQQAHYLLIFLPLIMPDILAGLSLLLLFVSLQLPLGSGSIIIAHATFCISYVAFVVLAQLEDFDFSVVEAARDLGAAPLQAFRLVVLPHLRPGILAGALLSFTLSFDDFVITFFVAGPGATTLPIQIYSMIRHGYPPLVNALSTILLAFTFLSVWICQRLIRRGSSS